jgi:multisubunit Na+/H+ antiporter MnhB subunit
MQSADKYDNTKLSRFLLLASIITIGVYVYWGIVLGAVGSFIGYCVYPILMLLYLLVIPEEKKNKLFSWKHSLILIYVFFGLWAL